MQSKCAHAQDYEAPSHPASVCQKPLLQLVTANVDQTKEGWNYIRIRAYLEVYGFPNNIKFLHSFDTVGNFSRFGLILRLNKTRRCQKPNTQSNQNRCRN